MAQRLSVMGVSAFIVESGPVSMRGSLRAVGGAHQRV